MRTTKRPARVRWPESEARAMRRAAVGAIACMILTVAVAGATTMQARAAYAEMAESAELRAEEAESRADLCSRAAEYWAKEAEAARAGQSVTAEYIGEYMCTAYCAEAYPHICGTGDGITASGAPVTPGVTCAAPASIPFGTVLYIEGVGVRIVQDRGGAVTGNSLDVATETHADALQWAGYGEHRVYILGTPAAESGKEGVEE